MLPFKPICGVNSITAVLPVCFIPSLEIIDKFKQFIE